MFVDSLELHYKLPYLKITNPLLLLLIYSFLAKAPKFHSSFKKRKNLWLLGIPPSFKLSSCCAAMVRGRCEEEGGWGTRPGRVSGRFLIWGILGGEGSQQPISGGKGYWFGWEFWGFGGMNQNDHVLDCVKYPSHSSIIKQRVAPFAVSLQNPCTKDPCRGSRSGVIRVLGLFGYSLLRAQWFHRDLSPCSSL